MIILSKNICSISEIHAVILLILQKYLIFRSTSKKITIDEIVINKVINGVINKVINGVINGVVNEIVINGVNNKFINENVIDNKIFSMKQNQPIFICLQNTNHHLEKLN
jgi:hypothetical protein